jgi:hypothetical protein
LPGFVSAISGDFGVKGVAANLDLSIDKVVSHINELPIALSVSARYHRWEFFADGEWVQLGVTANLRDLLFTQADLQMGYAFWEGFVGYRLINCDKAVLSLYAGARYTYYSADFAIAKSNDPPTAGHTAERPGIRRHIVGRSGCRDQRKTARRQGSHSLREWRCGRVRRELRLGL